MAAPGEGKEGTFCDRCFAPLAKGAAYCDDCGAPTGEAAPGAESPIHRELAQANLLRLRGDLDGSEKALLAALRRLPNDPLAHEMLGDVCADRGENARAVEWYELSLDLAPNSPEVRRKLALAADHQEAAQTADTAETLGLPSAKPPAPWLPLAGAGVILALAIVVAAWPRSAAPSVRRAVVEASAPTVAPEPAPQTAPSTAPSEPAPAKGDGAETEGDRKLLAALQTGTEGMRVQSVVMDPRGSTLDVTFEVAEADDPKALATALGKAALDAAPSAATITLRAVRAHSLVFAADFPRSAIEAAEPLTNVWPTPPEPPAAGVSGATTAGTEATTGSGATANGTTAPASGSSTTPGATAPTGSATTGGNP